MRRLAVIGMILILGSAGLAMCCGIFIGSESQRSENLLIKRCFYISWGGYLDLPAWGGFDRGVGLVHEPDKIYCRVLARFPPVLDR